VTKEYPLTRAITSLLRSTASEAIMPRFRSLREEDVQEKAPDDFVTVADRESELLLSQGLRDLDPAARIVGEEACAADPSLLSGLDRGRVWLVDPIDGTGNFAAGKAPFGIMLALLEDGATTASWLYDPLSGRLCHAHRGCGAFIDGEPVHSRGSSEARPIAALATYFMSSEQRADLMARAEGRFQLTAIPRCAAEQYPRLVLGKNDIAVFQRTLPWDHAPGALFLEEAGGKSRRADGSPYLAGEQRTGMLAAATPRLWDEAAAILYG
jgi:fructose-1,6-bisphosphatase/inositol monophosphatase family enzyme